MSVLDAEFDSLAVGDRFETRGRTITEADVIAFACLTGDMHPQHTDAAWASTSVFGERIAHGMLVASFAFGLVPFDPDRVMALRRVRDAVFKRPVSFGDTIRVQGRIDRRDEVDEATGIVGVRLDVINQRELTVARLAAEVLWRRGDAASDGRGNGSEPIARTADEATRTAREGARTGAAEVAPTVAGETARTADGAIRTADGAARTVADRTLAADQEPFELAGLPI